MNMLPLIALIILCPVFAIADWSSTLKTNFDFADTFDTYDDWTGNAADAECASYVSNQLSAPSYSTDQTKSEYWRQHCYYGRIGGTRPTAIGYHGPGLQVSAKSMRVSHPGSGVARNNGEMNNVKTYFGDGSQDSGYADVYIFFRMYLSRKAFPTYTSSDHTTPCYDLIDGGYVRPCYIDGMDFAYLDSWKWVAVNMGYINEAQFLDTAIDDNACRWGLNEIHFHIKGGASQNYEKRVGLEVGALNVNIMGSVDISPFFDTMVGVELHLRRESGKKTGDGIAEVTFYDANGNGTQVLLAENINLVVDEDNIAPTGCWGTHTDVITQTVANSLKFNRINFEANKRINGTNGLDGNNYTGGVEKNESGTVIGDMQNEWYIDDFIVNDSEIGPTYFSLLGESGLIKTLRYSPGQARQADGTGRMQ